MYSKMQHLARWELLGTALLALALWQVYVKSLSSAYPGNDSPETISASYELGIQHPPGYPAHTLLGRVAILALPLGSPALRVNLLSAALAVWAALLLAWMARSLVLEQGQTRGAAWLAGLVAMTALGLWRAYWEQATEAKGGIYLLNIGLSLAMLQCCLAWLKQGQARSLRLLGLLAGLSLAHHYASALWVIVLCALWIGARQRSALLKPLPFLVPGLTLYILLPLRASAGVFNDLGHPVDAASFWWVLSRAGYSQASLLGDFSIAADQARLWFMHVFSFGAFWVAPLGAWGLLLFWRHDRLRAALVVTVAALITLMVLGVNRTQADTRWLADIFVLPAQAILALGAGLGAARLSRGRLLLGLPGLALGGAALLLSHFGALNRSRDFAAYDFAANLNLSLPARAIYVGEGDYHVLPLYYPWVVQGRRRDVEPVVSSLLEFAPYAKRLAQRRPDVALDLETRPRMAGLLKGKTSPRVLGLYHPALDLNAWGLKPVAYGLSHRIDLAAPARGFTPATWSIRHDGRWPLEPLLAALWPWYSVACVDLGNALSQSKRPLEAARAYALALALPGEKPESKILFNLGQSLAIAGALEPGRKALQRSLILEPGLQASRQALAWVEARWVQASQSLRKADSLAGGSQIDQALLLYRQAAAQGLASAALWRNVAVLEYKQGKAVEAVKSLAEALRFDSRDPVLYQYQGAILRGLKREREARETLLLGWQLTGDANLKTMIDSPIILQPQ